MRLNPGQLVELAAAVAVVALMSFIALRRFSAEPAERARVTEELGVGDLLQRIKAELRAADEQQVRSGSAALFQVGAVDVEISYATRRVVSAEGKVEYRVVALTGAAEESSERGQKITIHLSTINDTSEQVIEMPDPVLLPPELVAPTRR